MWYLLGCSASKGPQQELLQYLLGYWAEKNMTGDNVLLYDWYLLGVEKNQATPTKQALGTS